MKKQDRVRTVAGDVVPEGELVFFLLGQPGAAV
jgi:hypothetical protein